MATASPGFAFYYPNPIWHSSDSVKNLILFFDGIALLVPEYMQDRPSLVDPAMTSGLKEHGLLKIIEPESFIDKKAATAFATAMTDVIVSGSLDNLAKDSVAFRELSYSRLGYMADAELALMIYQELKGRGLAKESEDGVSIPMHPLVRSLVLVLWAQILRETGRKHNLELHPVTDRPEILTALKQLLNLDAMPSAGHVVSLDLETVGVDVSAIPLDEVLRFRAEHGENFQAYARTLREFTQRVADLSPGEVAASLEERRAEIRAAAADLRKDARRVWKRRTSFALGIAGAAWRAHHGDPIGSLLALGGGVLGADLASSQNSGAYSYLFTAKLQLT